TWSVGVAGWPRGLQKRAESQSPARSKGEWRPTAVQRLLPARPGRRGLTAGRGEGGGVSREGRCFSAPSPGSTAALELRASPGVATTTSTVMPKHEFSVDMTCEGCSNAVSRVLNKLGGVEFDIDLPNKKVCINSEHSVDLLLETLGKTGKAVSYLGPK
uniref:Copper transport protein ATOX1 n=1 Tax=Panthera leo TaxID=9689 RepID=A0A8C8W9Z0_PANLE